MMLAHVAEAMGIVAVETSELESGDQLQYGLPHRWPGKASGTSFFIKARRLVAKRDQVVGRLADETDCLRNERHGDRIGGEWPSLGCEPAESGKGAGALAIERIIRRRISELVALQPKRRNDVRIGMTCVGGDGIASDRDALGNDAKETLRILPIKGAETAHPFVGHPADQDAQFVTNRYKATRAKPTSSTRRIDSKRPQEGLRVMKPLGPARRGEAAAVG